VEIFILIDVINGSVEKISEKVILHTVLLQVVAKWTARALSGDEAWIKEAVGILESFSVEQREAPK